MTSDDESATTRPRRPLWIEDAERLDLAIYAAIAVALIVVHRREIMPTLAAPFRRRAAVPVNQPDGALV